MCHKGGNSAACLEEHRSNGHFHRDNIKAKLLDKVTSPKMDQSITKAILDCGKCKVRNNASSFSPRANYQTTPV